MRSIGLYLAFMAGVFVAFILYAITTLLTRKMPTVNYNKEQMSYSWTRTRTSSYASATNFVIDQYIYSDEDLIAKQLAEKVRVLCFVMTSPQNVESRVKYVMRTWGRRCNKLVIISSKPNSTYGIVGIDVKEGREQLTQKTLGGFRYIYEHHLNDADWFLKADDDTYVIMENLRYLLSNEDTNEPIYFGQHFKAIKQFDYSSGGSGFVISKEALRRFGKASSSPYFCQQDGAAADSAFGECLGMLGVELKNSTDVFGKSRFHCLTPHDQVTGTVPEWLYEYDANGVRKGVDSISDYVISFHYVLGNQMDTLEYLIYHARPYGLNSVSKDVNQH